MQEQQTFYLGSGRSGKFHRVEQVLEGRYAVDSRSGLHETEKALIAALPRHPKAVRLLLLGHRTGALAMVASAESPGRTIHADCLDVHHARGMERNLLRNRAVGIDVACRPYVEERDLYDLALLQLARGDMSGELVEDVLQQAHLALRRQGRCLTAVEGDAHRLAARMKDLFGGCSVKPAGRSVTLLESVKTEDLRKVRRFEAEFEMTLPGGPAVRLRTIPGVFAHRRADEGALALAETVEVRAGDAVLDMGCGCGAVGLALAAKTALSHVTFVDSNVRATHLTQRNCELNGLRDYDVVLSDAGLKSDRLYSVCAANPPYFGDFKIAEFFIRTAFDCLGPAGRVYVVSKQGARVLELMREAFGTGEILRRRSYEIVRAVKPDGPAVRGR